MRIIAQSALGRWDLHAFQQFARSRTGPRLVGPLVTDDRFDDLPPDRVHRIEGEHRLLKDHRNQRAPQFGECALVELVNSMLANSDDPRHRRALLRQEPH
jgi:hypothetical protein